MYRLHRGVHAYGGGAAAAFSPADLSPLVWCRYGVGVTEAGGFASNWADQSGNGYDLAQATGLQQPAYSAGVLTFDGSNDRMETGAIAALDQPTTIIYLLKQVSWTNNEYLADGGSDNVGALRQTTSSPKISIYAGSTACEQDGPAIGDFGVVVCVFNGASSYTRVNNGAKVTGNPGAGTMLGITLGGPGASGINYGHVAYKEVAAWDSALSDSDVDSMVAYLLAL